ncbi:MAG: hypothetical protein C0506_16260 [Anaerolinea sp.]|nr:hypothetical protein [Anaerolinea sp.]
MSERRVDQCLTEQELDEYLFNRVEGPESDLIEEHLLFCSQCQSRVETEMDFVRDFRSAARIETRPRPAPIWRWSAAAGVAASVILGVWLMREAPPPSAGGPPILVSLNVARGLPLDDAAVAPAGRSIRLSARLNELPALPVYQVEVAGSGGARILRKAVAPTRGSLELALDEPLDAGVYWVRIYDGGTLLREFALRVK